MKAGVLDRSSRISSTNNHLQMIATRARLALKNNEASRASEDDQTNFQSLLFLFGPTVELQKAIASMRGIAYRDFTRKYSRSDQRLIGCFNEAANTYFGETSTTELEEMLLYLRRYAFAKKHSSAQYQKAIDFIEYLKTFHARVRH